MNIGVWIFPVLLLTALFAVGFYFLQKRFWPQERNNSQTAPPSSPEGVGNKLGEQTPVWRPPNAG